MSIDGKCHILALKDRIELMSISAIIAILADLLWLVIEITTTGMTNGKFCVGVGLTLALIVAVFATLDYHFESVKRFRLEMTQQTIINLKMFRRQ